MDLSPVFPSPPSKRSVPHPISAPPAAKFPSSISPASTPYQSPAPLRTPSAHPRIFAVPCTPPRGCFSSPPRPCPTTVSLPVWPCSCCRDSPQSFATPPNTPAALLLQPESHRHGEALSPWFQILVCLEFALRSRPLRRAHRLCHSQIIDCYNALTSL